MKVRVAVLDDEPRMAEILGMVLERDGYEVLVFTEPGECLAAQKRQPFDALLTDLRMPGMDGGQVFEAARAVQPDLPVVFVTAHGTIDDAVEMMRRGAADYLTKPVDNTTCRRVVKRALEVTRLQRENRYLRAEQRSRYSLDDIVAVSTAMRDVFDTARRVAGSNAPVLISGPTGTGKELVARFVHYHSDRVRRPMESCNCKALAGGLLESELFGHEKGAFTGAVGARRGLFERGRDSTVFLDEIGEIDADFQGKLLRVLQEKEVQRVGGDRVIDVDVRVISATNRELLAEVEAGRFREDLYYRLAVVDIRIPPLRERRADVLPLARFFLGRFVASRGGGPTAWSTAVEDWLQAHDWPGNVRQLENAIHRGHAMARTDTIELDDVLPSDPSAVGPMPVPHAEPRTLQQIVDAATAEAIREALDRTGGRRADAAHELGVERTKLYRLMRRLDIEEG